MGLIGNDQYAGIVRDRYLGHLLPRPVENGRQRRDCGHYAGSGGGFYFINNMRSGTYTLRAPFIGFVAETVEGIRVSTGLTTETNFILREEAVGLAEIVVTSERPIVQLDVSANVSNLDPENFVDLPIKGVSEVLDSGTIE